MSEQTRAVRPAGTSVIQIICDRDHPPRDIMRYLAHLDEGDRWGITLDRESEVSDRYRWSLRCDHPGCGLNVPAAGMGKLGPILHRLAEAGPQPPAITSPGTGVIAVPLKLLADALGTWTRRQR